MSDFAERLHMALAEAGYPDATVTDRGSDAGERAVICHEGEIPPRVAWQAFKVAGLPTLACWECWKVIQIHDPFVLPWPTPCAAPGLGAERCELWP